MASALPLEQIIRRECLSLKDCMLTVTDGSGETAFLYFKEGELVEANYATLWGRDALTEILGWKVVDRTIAPLPLGIKRSLWDPLEYLINPTAAPTSSGRLPVPAIHQKVPKSTGSSVLDRYKDIPNLLKMVQLTDKETVLYEGPIERGDPGDTAWLIDFASRVKAVGETLGFGACDKWTLETETNQMVGFFYDEKVIALLRRKDAMQDDLESAVTAITEAL